MHSTDRKLRTLTDEEEAGIQKGIAEDPDNPEWIESIRRQRGRPAVGASKRQISLRLDPDVIDAFKAKYGAEPRTPYALYGVQALQVILAAIEKSDGTRKGVRDQVFEGSGVSIAGDKAVIGKAIQIDPASGDVNAKDITVELVKGGKETFFKAQSVASA